MQCCSFLKHSKIASFGLATRPPCLGGSHNCCQASLVNRDCEPLFVAVHQAAWYHQLPICSSLYVWPLHDLDMAGACMPLHRVHCDGMGWMRVILKP
jgi:hypothetical protein